MKSCLIVFVIITATHAATYFKPPANKTGEPLKLI